MELPNSGHFRYEIVFFLEAAFSAEVFILCVLHQHLAIIPAKIRLEATVHCAQRVLMFGTVIVLAQWRCLENFGFSPRF